jgi:hypothetical protein
MIWGHPRSMFPALEDAEGKEAAATAKTSATSRTENRQLVQMASSHGDDFPVWGTTVKDLPDRRLSEGTSDPHSFDSAWMPEAPSRCRARRSRPRTISGASEPPVGSDSVRRKPSRFASSRSAILTAHAGARSYAH